MTVAIVDINEQAFEKNHLFDASEESKQRLYSLEEYLTIAKKTIGKFASPSLAHQMLKSEDAISFVADHLMKGTLRWKQDGGRTFRAYLNQCAIWAIQRWVLNMKTANKHAVVSLDTPINDDGDTLHNLIEVKQTDSYSTGQFDDLIDKDYLKPIQKECLRMKFVENMTYRAIGEVLKKSGARIEQIIKAALAQLREDDEYSHSKAV